MTITLDVAGGFAPAILARRLVVDPARLDEAERVALLALVDAAFAAPPRPLNPAARDARSYEITVTSEEGVRRLIAADGALNGDMRRLMTALERLARSGSG